MLKGLKHTPLFRSPSRTRLPPKPKFGRGVKRAFQAIESGAPIKTVDNAGKAALYTADLKARTEAKKSQVDLQIEEIKKRINNKATDTQSKLLSTTDAIKKKKAAIEAAFNAQKKTRKNAIETAESKRKQLADKWRGRVATSDSRLREQYYKARGWLSNSAGAIRKVMLQRAEAKVDEQKRKAVNAQTRKLQAVQARIRGLGDIKTKMVTNQTAKLEAKSTEYNTRLKAINSTRGQVAAAAMGKSGTLSDEQQKLANQVAKGLENREKAIQKSIQNAKQAGEYASRGVLKARGVLNQSNKTFEQLKRQFNTMTSDTDVPRQPMIAQLQPAAYRSSKEALEQGNIKSINKLTMPVKLALYKKLKESMKLRTLDLPALRQQLGLNKKASFKQIKKILLGSSPNENRNTKILEIIKDKFSRTV